MMVAQLLKRCETTFAFMESVVYKMRLQLTSLFSKYLLRTNVLQEMSGVVKSTVNKKLPYFMKNASLY